MIIYEYDSNHIYGDQIKYRNAEDFTRAYEKVQVMFTSQGLQLNPRILDHELSNMLNNFMAKVDQKICLCLRI